MQEFERIPKERVPAEHWNDSGLWRWTVIDGINAAMLGAVRKHEIGGMLRWQPAVSDISAAYDQAKSGHW